MSNNYLSALNKSLQRQSQIQEQLSDGKAIHRPSDDPIKTIRSLRFNTNLAINEQFTQNVEDSLSWMQTTDGAMSDLSSIMTRVKELVVSADGTKPIDSLNAIGTEIDQLINQALSIGNSKIGDRYIFAGQMDKIQPFERKQITDPNSNKVTDVVVYNGDLNKISMQIKPGGTNPSEDGVNLTGAEVFGPVKYLNGNPTMEIFNQLIGIQQELKKTAGQITTSSGALGTATIGGTYTGTGYTNFDVRIDSIDPALPAGQVKTASYSLDGGNTWTSAATVVGNPSTLTLINGVTLNIAADADNSAKGSYTFRVPMAGGNGPDTSWLSKVGLDNVDNAHNAQLKQHTQLGARMATYEMAKNMMESNATTITSDISANEDLDIPSAIIDQKTSESVYRAALAVGAKIMPPSLVDFLR